MSLMTVWGTAALLGLVAVLLTGWLLWLARTDDSRWITSGLHPALAALGGAGAALLARDYVELVALATAALACALLIAVDLATHRLPDVIVTPAYPIVFGCFAVYSALAGEYSDLMRSALAGLVLAGAFLILALVAPSGMGLGDVKLAGLLGITLGWYGWEHVLTGVIGAFVLGGLFSIGLLVFARATRKTAVAFGPWLVAGAVAGLLWGGALFGAS